MVTEDSISAYWKVMQGLGMAERVEKIACA